MQISADSPDRSECSDSPNKASCVFSKMPYPECYCNRLSSANISKIVKFCMDDFESCRIYTEWSK